MRVRLAPGSSFPTTFPKPNWSGSTLGASFREGSLPSMTVVVVMRHRFSFQSSALIVFAEALTAPRGELRVWATPWHQERALPALRALLDLPFVQVIRLPGEPVHTRAAYERALGLSPWSG